MNFLNTLVGNATKTATQAASDAAAAKAQAAYDANKPLIWAVAFMVGTAWVFFFLPRFRWPWEKT